CERVTCGRVHPTVAADTLVERVASLRSRFEVLRREDARRLRAVVEYANETGCRSVALRRYFGDEDPTPCGRCDLCRTNGVAPPERFAGRRDRRPHRGRERRPHFVPEPLPLAEGGAPAPVVAAPSDGTGRRRRRHRRRRRRRRGHGPRPEAAPTPG